MSIEFADPPPANSGSRNTKWTEVVESLKARPGEWAIIRRDATGANRFQSIHQYLERFYGLDVVCRKVDGETRLYARWPEQS